MTIDSDSRWRRQIFVCCIAMVILGLSLFYLGYQGLSRGSVEVYLKSSGKHFMAYAKGPHAASFVYEVWLHMIAGGGMAMLGVFGLRLWVFGGPARRERARVAVEAMRSRHTRVPGWLAFVVISAFVSVCLWAGFVYRR
ncbi:hypothetical protein ACS7SF_21130 (plasmid) [Ralstonia sp. 25C]|uniref:hypothetical protein n=1 Tax=Ralstonia sp. 25C TaxID=3447363 RepID=UPI003F74B8A2